MSMRIFISYQGTTRGYQFDTDTKISRIKQMLTGLLVSPVDEFRVTCHGRMLNADQTLGQCNIKDNDTINIKVRTSVGTLSVLLSELEQTPTTSARALHMNILPKTSCNTMSASVHPDDIYTVCVDIIGRKDPVLSFRHPYGDEDVEHLLLDYCKFHRIVLSACHVTLSGRAFDMPKGKGMKVQDLPDDPRKGAPWFVVHS